MHVQDTWYDAEGLNSQRFVRLDLPRKKFKQYPDGPYGDDVMHLSWENGYTGADVINQVVEDDTLPGGQYEKTIEYHAPWVRCSRERDYELVWGHFERRFGRRFS